MDSPDRVLKSREKMEPGSYTTREGFENVLRHVRMGDFPWMESLLNGNQWPPDDPDWVLEAVDAYMVHLDVPMPARISKLTPDDEDKQTRAAMALAAVATGLEEATRSECLKRVDEHLEPIFSWMHWLARASDTRVLNQALKIMVVGLSIPTEDTRLVVARLCCSPCVIDALIALFETSVDPEDQDFFDEGLLFALSCAIQHRASRTLLYDKLLSFPPSRTQNFAAKVVSLIDSYEACVDGAPGNDRNGLDLYDMFKAIFAILNHISSEWRLSSYFLREYYVGRYFEALARTLPRIGKLFKQFDQPALVDTYVANIMLWVDAQRGYAYQVAHDLVDAGLLQYIADRLDSLEPGSEEDIQMLDQMVTHLIGYMRSARVWWILDYRFNLVPENLRKRLSSPEHPGFPIWTRLSAFITVHFRGTAGTSKAMFQYPIYCQNLKHCEREVELERCNSDYLKTCSRCQSVVYCSETCQREDWDQIHKRECSTLRRVRSDLKEDMYWVPWQHRFRSLDMGSRNIAVLESTGNAHMIDDAIAETYPKASPHDVVYINRASVFMEREVVSVDKYRDRVKKNAPWALGRFEAMASKVRKSKHLRFLGFVFPFAASRVHFLCIANRGGSLATLFNGIMYIEYREADTSSPDNCKLPCCF